MAVIQTKKKINWITPSYFIDVDLPIVKELSNRYEIHWIVLYGWRDSHDDEYFVREQVQACSELKVYHYRFASRTLSFKHLFEVLRVIRLAKSLKPDLYYLSDSFAPYGVFLYKSLLPISRCVVACHNVTTPKGAKKERFARFYTNWWLRTFKNIQTFSENQCSELKKKYSGKNVLMAHLALKDYGEPTENIDKNNLGYIRFLVFGNIVHYKRIDLLLKAANILWDKGIKNFRVRIAGSCIQWEQEYAPLIKHPELFELNIKRIPNEEVADLFADSHYFVMPYQDIAQSGAIIVAYRYNVPALVSDIPQFNEFVKDGLNGFTFHTQDEHALADKMLWIIQNHKQIYPRVCDNLRKYINDNLTLESITQKYISYFDKL